MVFLMDFGSVSWRLALWRVASSIVLRIAVTIRPESTSVRGTPYFTDGAVKAYTLPSKEPTYTTPLSTV